MKGTVYLTDGFARLDLPGRECVFALKHDWVIRGSRCSWIWPHKDKVTVAGAEVVTRGRAGEDVTWTIGVGTLHGPPQIVEHHQKINFTPSIVVTPNDVE